MEEDGGIGIEDDDIRWLRMLRKKVLPTWRGVRSVEEDVTLRGDTGLYLVLYTRVLRHSILIVGI